MTFANWRAAGAAMDSLDRLSALLLVGDSTVSLAAAARGVADRTARTRRVAIFDLAGAFGLHDPDGLIAAFRDGRSLNALARPLADGDDARFVVARGPGELDDAFASHERWPRLVRGFRDTGALLIIVAPTGFGGLPTLAELTDLALYLVEHDDAFRFVVWPPSDADLFEDPPRENTGDTIALSNELRAETLPPHFAENLTTEEMAPPGLLDDDLAEETVPEHPLLDAPVVDEHQPVWEGAPDSDSGQRRSPPPLVRITPVSSVARVRARRRAGWIALAAILLLAVGGWYWSLGRGVRPGSPGQTLATASGTASLPDSAFVLPPLANPEDSARSSAWAVELLATNDRADAITRLTNGTLAAATVSPVLLGADGGTWYKLLSGAFVERAGAEYLRATLRKGGTLDPDAGVVSRTPYSLRLERGISTDAAKERVVRYVARGIPAYALLDETARATVYVGAFASPDQAIILLAELRAAGLEPELAYRVGRTF